MISSAVQLYKPLGDISGRDASGLEGGRDVHGAACKYIYFLLALIALPHPLVFRIRFLIQNIGSGFHFSGRFQITANGFKKQKHSLLRRITGFDYVEFQTYRIPTIALLENEVSNRTFLQGIFRPHIWFMVAIPPNNFNYRTIDDTNPPLLFPKETRR